MLKKHRNKKTQEIQNLSTQCEVIEEQVSKNLHEILKIVDSLNKTKLKKEKEADIENTTGTTSS